ncbi:MAG TPA: hypothetical protein PKY82_04355 [Pyrinomonadaceae bacterium]|nr:hypothetical protein [Pyrinomonadaceae bacterium]
MINRKFKAKIFGITFLVFSSLTGVVFAQNKDVKPTTIYNQGIRKMAVAERNNVFCAGYIQNSAIDTSFEIVGADEERQQQIMSQGDFIYVNKGTSSGVKVGDVFSVIRPKGKFSSKFSSKGKLGTYVQEVGLVEVIRVRQDVSVAKVKTSCDNLMYGDLLKPWDNRSAPTFTKRPALDTFAEPNGKLTGRIVLARDAREEVSHDQIVYIDLGAEDNVQAGDYLTIYRPLGKGGIFETYSPDDVSASSEGYQSESYKGDKNSIMAARKSGANAEGPVVRSGDAKSRRPAGLRKVVGEMVILNVKERTATALITRNAQEIHTGDSVEIQ